MKNTLIINLDAPGQKINPHIYGHFAEHLGRCIYDGLYVGPDSPIPNKNGMRLDIVEALKNLKIPNLRWPGGCFADEYHWKDGIGPKEERPAIMNTHWGGVVEDNSFGTHEFMELCELLETEPYICGNVGSGTVQEMSQWVEYLTAPEGTPMGRLRAQNGRVEPWKVKYWGVGNENWGCGGNMTAEFYADQAKRYATYCRNYGDNRLYKIAGGPNSGDCHWMETLMKELVHCPGNCSADRYIQGISLHYYTIRDVWKKKGGALDAESEHWDALMGNAWYMKTLFQQHKAIMDRYDPEKKIGLILDEWGTWHDVEEGTNPGFLFQQNTIRDALVASLHFDLFHKNADRLQMANIAQTVNVLQSMVLTEGERMILTPTYHVFEMNKKHQGAESLPLFAVGETPVRITPGGKEYETLSASASRTGESTWLCSLTNMDPEAPCSLDLDLRGACVKSIVGRILTSPVLNGHNSFDNPEAVKPETFEGFLRDNGKVSVILPPRSFVTLEMGG